MANELFGNVAENRTTLEVEVEPTTMVVGTTDNSNVGETKTRNMFTRPGFFSWIMNRNQKRIPNQTVFTIEQFEEIVRQSLQQFKLEEANRVRGAALSTSVKEELGLIFETNNKDDLRQYKKNVHRYDDGPWTTTKTINKEFILKLKQWKKILDYKPEQLPKYTNNYYVSMKKDKPTVITTDKPSNRRLNKPDDSRFTASPPRSTNLKLHTNTPLMHFASPSSSNTFKRGPVTVRRYIHSTQALLKNITEQNLNNTLFKAPLTKAVNIEVIEDVHAEHLDIFHLEKDSQLEDFWALGTGAQ
ncbi:unnamed protein product [Rhizopus microsporus]